MKERLARNTKLIAIVSALLVLCIAVAVAVGLFLREDKLEELQNEAIAELERNEGQYDERSIVLRSTSKARAEELAALFGAELRITENGRYARLSLPEGVTLKDVWSVDENRQYLEEMSADYQVRISDVEEEEDTSRLPVRPDYTVSDADYALQTYLDYINMQNLWNNYTGAGVTVAVIDTGIDTDHPEFAGRISEYSYNATEDKIVKDWGYDWSLIEDEQGHGTAVTGVIAGTMNSGNIVGIAPNVNIIVIKAECAPDGSFYRTSDLVFGLYYAIERDVQVVNMSFGTYSLSNPFAEATQLAYDSDIICVAAAGNDGTAALTYPAADPNVIGVGALAEDSWSLADYSNYGDNSDIVAPGTVYTSLKDGTYGTINGTSFSSPIVAATVALFMQNNKYVTFDEVTEVLFASSYDLGALGNDWDYGFGALDVYSFVRGERGTVTYDMLTDELENEEGLFIRGIALQELPEPERLYAVFDGWYYDDTFTQTVDYYADAFEGDITLYAKWVNEDDGVPYTYVILDDGTVEIRSYTGHRRFITVPEKIEGRIVSSIGDFAFAGQSRLREVTLPSGLNKIGRYAFQNCSNLVTMHIPAGVKTIGEYAFQSNARLYTLSFDANSVLESIRTYAFSDCGSLERIELPATLQSVDGSAFFGTTALTAINVRNGNTSFISIDGVLFDVTASTLVAYPAAHGTSYTVPASTVSIGNLAFPMARLKTIDLGTAQTIGNQAFVYSTLESLLIPDSVVSVGESSFFGNTSLSSLVIGRGLNSVSAECFAGCVSLNTVLIPNNIVTIDGLAFAGSGLSTVVFESGSNLAAIGGKAFFNCNISVIDIPASVTTIGIEAFSGTFVGNPLVSVTFAENSQLHTIGGAAFAKCNLLADITIPESLKTIGDQAFMSTALKEITVPSGVTSLGYGAFACCNSLTSIEIAEGNTVYHDVNGVVYTLDNTRIHMYPAGREEAVYTIEAAARTISPWAFAGTSKLGCAVLPEGLTEIGEYGFHLCGATTYVLPSTLTHIMAHAFDTSYNLNSLILPEALVQIAEYAFTNCSSLPSIHIPDNVLLIGRYAFSECWNLSTISFNPTSKLPRISYGAFAYSGITNFTVPANVSTIAQEAFTGCKKLYNVTFAENSKLESISAYMFDGCDNLQSIIFLSGSKLTSIQPHGFEGMDRLTYIDFGDAKLTKVDNFAFRFCESLSSITFPETLTNIGRYAFYGCKNLSALTVPANVEHIGSYAFLGTNELDLYLAADSMPAYLDENWDHGIAGYYVGVTSVNTLGDYKYATLTSGNIAIIEYLGTSESVDLTTLNLGAPITAIGGGAFKDSTVKSIVLPETLTEIQAEAFTYTALESINIPASVTFIGREAFAHTDITTLNIPANSSLKYIEQYAFEGTKNLKFAILPASLERMGTGVFLKSGLEAVVFADGIKLAEIPQRAFAETKLIAVALPDSVTLVNHNAFNNVDTLQSVSFGNNEGIRLMSNAFYHTGLTSLHIPANVTYIGEYCFVALKNLTEFTVDANNPNYAAIDGLLVSKSGRKLIAVPAGREGVLNVPVSIEEIGFGAFEESSLSAINFDPNANILTFGYRAFFKAENITEMNIPASVVSIDYYAFAYCENLKNVNFAEGNKLKGIYEGAFCGCINLENITIPDSIVEISDFAFYGCSKITKLPISENNALKGIYDYAFAYTGLSGEFTTPETLIDIGNYAFLGCKFTKVTVPDTNKKTLLIGIGAFEGCNKLTEITLPFIGASFEDEEISWFGYIFGAGAYEANETYVPKSLKTVTITDGITFIGIGGFAYCKGLENINVPYSVSVLWNDVFANTPARYELTNVISSYNNIIDWEFFGKGISGELKLSNSIISIEIYAFRDAEYLETIVLPEHITEIPTYSFAGCYNLKNVVFPSSLTYIGESAFISCRSLEKLHFPDELTEIDKYAFANCMSLKNIIIPKYMAIIGEDAFSFCVNVKTIENKSSLPISLGNEDFGSVAYYAETLIENNGNIIHKGDIEGIVYLDTPDGFRFMIEKEQYKLVSYIGTNDTVVLPAEINGKNYRIYHFSGAKNVIIPEGRLIIEDEAFLYSDIESITIAESVTEIGSSAFARCLKLKRINWGKGLVIVNDSAFSNCQSLRNVIIPGNVKSIGSKAFGKCEKLESVWFGDGVEIIGAQAFGSCAKLKEVHLSNSIKTIGRDAFDTCESLNSIYIPAGVSFIGSGAFSSDMVVSISENNDNFQIINGVLYDKPATTLITVFDWYSTHIDIPDGVNEIPWSAFENCDNLESISIPDSVTKISGRAFLSCEKLKHVYGANKVITIEDQAFYYCSSLVDFQLSKSVLRIGGKAFIECHSLNELIIPETIELIGYTAFDGFVKISADCELKNFDLIDGVIYDKSHTKIVASGKTSKTISIPDGITEIPFEAFKNCTTIQTVNLPQSLKVIGSGAFMNCVGLNEITIPSSVETIGDMAFYNCNLYIIHNNSDLEISIGTTDFGWIALNAYLVIDKDGNNIYRDTYSDVEFIDTSDGFRFVKIANRYTLLSYLGTQNEITLPDSIYGNQYDIVNFSSDAEKIVIPGTMKYIDSGAFAYNSNVKQIIINPGVVAIKAQAFAYCVNLRSIVLPNTIVSLSSQIVYNCRLLYEIDIPDSVLAIGQFTFDGSSVYNNPDYYVDGMLVIDGWLIDIIEKDRIKYLEDFDYIKGAAISAYANTYTIKQRFWNNYNDSYSSNVETIIIKNMNNLDSSLGESIGNDLLVVCHKQIKNTLTLKNIVISDVVKSTDLMNNPQIFAKLNDVIIFVEHLEEDLRWDDSFPGWSNGNRVVYKDSWSWSNFYDVDGTLLYSAPRLNSAIIRPPMVDSYESDGVCYEFVGWDLDGDGFADHVPATSVVDIEAHALYKVATRCEAFGHNYESTVVPPTVQTPGYTIHICSLCGDTFVDTFVDPIPYLPGDIDGNGEVEKSDAETILKYITGHDVLVVEAALDINGDGKINIRDAATILLYLKDKSVELN